MSSSARRAHGLLRNRSSLAATRRPPDDAPTDSLRGAGGPASPRSRSASRRKTKPVARSAHKTPPEAAPDLLDEDEESAPAASSVATPIQAPHNSHADDDDEGSKRAHFNTSEGIDARDWQTDLLELESSSRKRRSKWGTSALSAGSRINRSVAQSQKKTEGIVSTGSSSAVSLSNRRSVLKEQVLLKQNSTWPRDWVKRPIVLFADWSIAYYENSAGRLLGHERERMVLTAASSAWSMNEEGRFAIREGSGLDMVWIFEAADNKERDDWVDLLSKYILDRALAPVPQKDASTKDLDPNQTAEANGNGTEMILPASKFSVSALSVLRDMNDQSLKWMQASSPSPSHLGSSDARPIGVAPGTNRENNGSMPDSRQWEHAGTLSRSMPSTPSTKLGHFITTVEERPWSFQTAGSRKRLEVDDFFSAHQSVPAPDIDSKPAGNGSSASSGADFLTRSLLLPARVLRERILTTADALAESNQFSSLTSTSPKTGDPSIASLGMVQEDRGLGHEQHAKKDKSRKGARVRFHDEADEHTSYNEDESSVMNDDDVCTQHHFDGACAGTPVLVPVNVTPRSASSLDIPQPTGKHALPVYGPFLKDYSESAVFPPFCSADLDLRQTDRQSMSLKDRLLQLNPLARASGDQNPLRNEVELERDAVRTQKARWHDEQLTFWPSPPSSPSYKPSSPSYKPSSPSYTHQQCTQAAIHCATSTPFLRMQHVKDLTGKQQLVPVPPRRIDSSPESLSSRSPEVISSRSQTTSYSTRSCSSPDQSHGEAERQTVHSDSSESPRAFSCSISSAHQRLIAAVKGTISRLKSKSFVDDKQRDDRKIGQTRPTSATLTSSSPQTPGSIALSEGADNAQPHNDSREQNDMGAAFSSASCGDVEKEDSTSPRRRMLSLSCRRGAPEKPINKSPQQLLDALVEFIQEQGGSMAVADVSEFYETYPELAAEQVIAQMGGLRSFCGRNKHLVAYRAGYISLRGSASCTGHSSRPSSTELQLFVDHIPEQRITDARDNGWQGQNHHQENHHLHQHLEARRLVEQENEAAACVAAASLLKLSRTAQSPAPTPTALSPRELCAVTSKQHGDLVISESPAFMRLGVLPFPPVSQRDQSAQRAIIPKLPVHKQEPLVISESSRASRQSSLRAPRLKTPLAQADSLQKENLHVMPTHKTSSNRSPLASEYGPSSFMVRAEPARLVLQARQSPRGAEGRGSKIQTLPQEDDYAFAKRSEDFAEGSEAGVSSSPALGPIPLSVSSTPTVADGAGSWT